jgi:hypothetical protein
LAEQIGLRAIHRIDVLRLPSLSNSHPAMATMKPPATRSTGIEIP